MIPLSTAFRLFQFRLDGHKTVYAIRPKPISERLMMGILVNQYGVDRVTELRGLR